MTDLQFRLEQWGEWHRRGSIKPKQTGSFEGNFRPRYGAGWETSPPGPRPEEINVDDAWEIELATRNIGLKYHLALYLMYVHCARMNPEHRGGKMAELIRKSRLRDSAGNRLRMTGADAENMVGMAQVLVYEQLQLPAVERKERAAAWVKRQLPPIVESGVEGIHEGLPGLQALCSR